MSSPSYATQPYTATTTLDIALEQSIGGAKGFMSYLLKNTGATALNHFKIQRQFYASGDFVDWLSDSDFGTPTTVLRPSTTRPDTLAGSGSAWFDIDPGGAIALRFLASTGSSTTTIVIQGGGFRQ